MLYTLFVAIALALFFAALGMALHQRSGRSAYGRLLALWLMLAAAPPALLSAHIIYSLVAGYFVTNRTENFSGIEYSRRVIDLSDSRAVMHVAMADTKAFCLQIGYRTHANSRHPFSASYTSESLVGSDAVLATNASFFAPFKDNHLLDYFPHPGDAVRLVGFARFDQHVYGHPLAGWPLVVMDKYCNLALRNSDGSATFSQGFLKNKSIVLSARSWLLRDGLPVASPEGRRYPRLALALDASKGRLWLVAVDGKQPGYSAGLDLDEFAHQLQKLGAHEAVELDGGGSVTMAARMDEKITLLNRPAHTKIPGRERPVANQLLLIPKKNR